MSIEISGQLIMSREELDKKIKRDPALRGSIAGFSTISLHHTLIGLTQNGFSVPFFSVYGGVELDLEPSVYKKVFGEESIYTDLEELMEDNRGYGRWGAVIDYIMKQSYAPRSADQIWGEVISEASRLSEWYHFPNNLPVLLGMRSLYDHIKNQEEVRDEVEEIFQTEENFRKALIDIKNRKGVQLIYGERKPFSDFLRAYNAKSTGDSAALLTVPIPPEFVKIVVPLGKYEEHTLLQKKILSP